MWSRENRERYDRSHLRYESDLSDEEWAEVGPLIPPAKLGGNKRSVDIREVVNGVMYILSTGCQWRAIPKELPPRPGAQSTTTSSDGPMTEPWSGCTTRFM
jgi:transposase